MLCPVNIKINNFPAVFFGKTNGLSRAVADSLFVVVTQTNVPKPHKPLVSSYIQQIRTAFQENNATLGIKA